MQETLLSTVTKQYVQTGASNNTLIKASFEINKKTIQAIQKEAPFICTVQNAVAKV